MVFLFGHIYEVSGGFGEDINLGTVEFMQPEVQMGNLVKGLPTQTASITLNIFGKKRILTVKGKITTSAAITDFILKMNAWINESISVKRYMRTKFDATERAYLLDSYIPKELYQSDLLEYEMTLITAL